MGKVEDYIQAARDAAKVVDIPTLNARYDGVLSQFSDLGRTLVDAETAGDTSEVKKVKAVLEDNLTLRVDLVTKLEAAGDKKTDPLADAAIAADAAVKP